MITYYAIYFQVILFGCFVKVMSDLYRFQFFISEAVINLQLKICILLLYTMPSVLNMQLFVYSVHFKGLFWRAMYSLSHILVFLGKKGGSFKVVFNGFLLLYY